MTSDDAFLQALRDNPDDLAQRLVYADWLEEQGDPRGEYLRLSCRLAELARGIDPTWLAAVRESRYQVGRIRLRSGSVVSLCALRQYPIYEGLLEGYPTTESNRQIIDQLVAEERSRLGGQEPYLIRPVERPIEPPPRGPYRRGQPALLPPIACVGRLYSHEPTSASPGEDCSELVVIWFQNELALPIDPGVWDHLLGIDWDRHAINYMY